jgi:hypothetical protein
MPRTPAQMARETAGFNRSLATATPGTPLAEVLRRAMGNEVSRYRTLIEWTLSAMALATVIVVILALDSPVRQQATTAASGLSRDAIELRIPEPISRAARTAWRICMDHQPLAGFAGVALVLVLFMRRMR